MKLVRLFTLLILSLKLSGCLIAPLQPDEKDLFYLVFFEGAAERLGNQEVCPIHGIQTVAQEVPVYDGMTAWDIKYMKARVRRFPYSFKALYSNGCEYMGDRHESLQVCSKCREEEERWLKRHPTTIT